MRKCALAELGHSFQELLSDLPLKWNQIVPKNSWNINFLFRMFGVTSQLLPYLELCDDKRVPHLRAYILHAGDTVLERKGSVFKDSNSSIEKSKEVLLVSLKELNSHETSAASDRKMLSILIELA